MGPMNGVMNKLIGAAAVAAAVGSVSTKDKKEKKKTSGNQDENIDAKMAARARRIAQNKIKAIWNNAELSGKAKARRTGEVLKEIGGNK